MKELTISILEDLGIHWNTIIDLPDIARKPPIFTGDFIEAFLIHQKYENLADIFDIHVETIADIVDMVFPDKAESAAILHHIWF